MVYNFRSRRGENNPSGFLQESDDRYFLFQPEEFTVRPAAAVHLVANRFVAEVSKVLSNDRKQSGALHEAFTICARD